MKQVFKAITLWVTILSLALFIMGGFESLVETEQWLAAMIWLIINIALVHYCYTEFSFEEFYKLSGMKWLDKVLDL